MEQLRGRRDVAAEMTSKRALRDAIRGDGSVMLGRHEL